MKVFDRDVVFECPKCGCSRSMRQVSFIYVDADLHLYSTVKGKFIEVSCPDCTYVQRFATLDSKEGEDD